MIEDSKSAGRDTELGYLAYGGIMTGDTHKHIGMSVEFNFNIFLDVSRNLNVS